MEEYRLEIKVRNNLILAKIEELGYTSVPTFCKENHILYTSLVELISMKSSPLDRRGDPRVITIKLLNVFSCSLECLFSPNQLFALDKNRFKYNLSAGDVEKLIGPQEEPLLLEDFIFQEQKTKAIDECLKTLTPKEEKIMRLRFGLPPYSDVHTLVEVAEIFKVKRERIRQLEARCFRKIRDPSRSDALNLFVEED